MSCAEGSLGVLWAEPYWLQPKEGALDECTASSEFWHYSRVFRCVPQPISKLANARTTKATTPERSNNGSRSRSKETQKRRFPLASCMRRARVYCRASNRRSRGLGCPPRPGTLEPSSFLADRKSTRLNSSHLGIS